MIIHASRFGTIWAIRLDPTKDKVGDFNINIPHSDFQTQVQVWIKVCDGAR
jgi:hypothetical protein